MVIAVIGYGYMGKIYVRDLISLGIPFDDIIVVDKDSRRLKELSKDHPKIRGDASIDTVLEEKPEIGFVLVNTAFHFKVLSTLIKSGIKYIFVEKPLVTKHSESLKIRKMVSKFGVKIFAAYQINFSKAIEALLDLMQKEGLVVSEIRGIWGKNRIGDPRITAGDLEDEMTHMISLSRSLVKIGQKVKSVSIRSMATHLPFADQSNQRRAHKEDSSVPLSPISSTNLGIKIKTDLQQVAAMLTSSYISSEQVRRVELVLSKRRNTKRLSYIARLDFDTPKGDILTTINVDSKGKHEKHFEADQKVRDEVKAFLSVCAGSAPDHRLTGIVDAAEVVRIAETALKARL